MIVVGEFVVHLIEYDLDDAEFDDQLVSPTHSISQPFFSNISIIGISVVAGSAVGGSCCEFGFDATKAKQLTVN